MRLKKHTFYKGYRYDIIPLERCCMLMKNSLIKQRIGEKYEKLKIIGLEDGRDPKSGRKYYKYRCECDCGNEISIYTHNWKKSKSCRACMDSGLYGSKIKIEEAPKGVTYHRKYSAYRVRVYKDKKSYEIGMFRDLDVAIKIRDEAMSHIDNIDTWMEKEREQYILSVCPEYKFRNKRKKLANEHQKKLFSERNIGQLTNKMNETLEQLRKGPLYLNGKCWERDGWKCTTRTLQSLQTRDLVEFSADKKVCYLKAKNHR